MTPDRAQEIVDELTGTCRSIDECLEDGEDAMDQILVNCIDEHIFECEGCGWWYGIDEMSEQADFFCDECKPEDDA